MGAGACRDMRLALGCYVLGALGPADRAAVARHLARCPDCREERADLADLPAVLDKVPAGDVAGLLHAGPQHTGPQHTGPQHTGPPRETTPGPHPRRQTAKHRRRTARPWLAAAVAAVLVTAVGTVTATHLRQTRVPGAPALSWAGSADGRNPATHTSLSVRYAAQPWGLALDVQISGVPAGTTCQLLITGSDGQEIATASWTVPGGQQDAWYPATSSLPLASVRGFVVTTAAKTLISVPLR